MKGGPKRTGSWDHCQTVLSGEQSLGGVGRSSPELFALFGNHFHDTRPCPDTLPGTWSTVMGETVVIHGFRRNGMMEVMAR
jgi:hypothetical protein